MPPRQDRLVTIVGGGVIGLAVAFELLQRGFAVRVFDAGSRPGVATGAAGGMLAPISEAEIHDESVVRFGLDSLARYPRFVAEVERASGIGCDYRQEGTLWVAVTRDDDAELAHLARTLELRGLPFRRLDGAETLALEPRLSGRVWSGLLVERDHDVDARALWRALREAVRRSEGEILPGRVQEILVEHGTVRALKVEARAGAVEEVEADTVVLAAGAWATHEIVSPVTHLQVRPLKGQIVRLRAQAPVLRHVVRRPRLYLVPRTSGALLVGATMEELGYDERPTAWAAWELLRHAWEILPVFDELEFVELAVGFRPVVRDHRPVIGATDTGGLFVALGHGRGGILLAPATGHYLAEWIATGKRPEALAPFGPERLAPSPKTEDHRL